MTGKSPSLRSVSSPPEFEFRRGNNSGDDNSVMNAAPDEAPDVSFQAAVESDEKSDSAMTNDISHFTNGRHPRASSVRSSRSNEDRKAQSLFAKAVFELPPVLKALTNVKARSMLLNHYADQFEELGQSELMEEALKVIEMTASPSLSVSPVRDEEYIRHLEESSKEKGCESLDVEMMKTDKSYYSIWRSQKEQKDIEEAKRISLEEMKRPAVARTSNNRRTSMMPELLTKTPNSRIIRRALDLEGEFRKPSSQLIGDGYLSGKINRMMPIDSEEIGPKTPSDEMKNIVRAKTRPPERWNGEGEFEAYQDWVFHLDHYFKVIEFPKEYQVAEMSQFLSGKARAWFMRVVAKNATRWTVEKVNEALFDAFFPANLRSQFRHEFLTATQGNMTFKEFAEHVKNLASRLPNVDERDSAIRLWHGAQPYLRVKWAETGFNEELSELEDLEISGERFELAERNRLAQIAIRHLNSDVISPAKSNMVQYNPNGALSNPRNTKNSQGTGHQTPISRDFRSTKPQNLKIQMSQQRMNELKAEGRCFLCEEKGHISRDCPSTNILKPPAEISSNNVRFEVIEELENEINELSINAIGRHVAWNLGEDVDAGSCEIRQLKRIRSGAGDASSANGYNGTPFTVTIDDDSRIQETPT